MSEGIFIIAVSDIGEATTRFFGFNAAERLLERQALQVTGRYALPVAWQRIDGTN